MVLSIVKIGPLFPERVHFGAEQVPGPPSDDAEAHQFVDSHQDADVYDAPSMTHDDVSRNRDNPSEKEKDDHELLTKPEAWRELAVSLSTLDRRTASGEIPADGSHADDGTGCT